MACKKTVTVKRHSRSPRSKNTGKKRPKVKTYKRRPPGCK